MKQVYIFEVIDNDFGERGYMLYTNKNNKMTPVIEPFDWKGDFLKLDEIISVLQEYKITELITYHPQSDKVCSRPYEISNEDDFQACAEDGNWNLLNHMDIYLGQKDEDKFKENNISIKRLNDEEISELEDKLTFWD